MERLGHFHRTRSQAFACQRKVLNLYESDVGNLLSLTSVLLPISVHQVVKGQSQKDNMNLKH